MKLLVVLVLLVCAVSSKCTSLESDCELYAKFGMRITVNRKGVPTNQDILNNLFKYGTNCGEKKYTSLMHLPLSCKQLGKRSFNCVGTVESIWIRIWNPEEYKDVIENCGSQFTEKYQNIMLNPCMINGTDMWAEMKKSIGTTREISLIVHDDKTVEELNRKYTTGKCEWIYEIEGFWSSFVITVFVISISVVLVVIIALYVYANKHRQEKRSVLLSRSVADEDKSQSLV